MYIHSLYPSQIGPGSGKRIEWTEFVGFMQNHKAYLNTAMSMMAHIKGLKFLSTDCNSQRNSSKITPMTLDQIQQKAPIFNWKNYVNSQLPDNVQVRKTAVISGFFAHSEKKLRLKN